MHKELIDNIPCIPDFSEVLYYKLFIKKIISKIPINLKRAFTNRVSTSMPRLRAA